MNRRGTGALFCLTAAMLFAARYVCAAIFGSGASSWDTDLFSGLYSYVGTGLTTCSIVALVLGILYLIWAEIKKE